MTASPREDRAIVTAQYRSARLYLLLALLLLAGTSLYLIAEEGMAIWRTAHMQLANLARGFEASTSGLLEQSVAGLEGVATDLAGVALPPRERTLETLRDAARFVSVSDYVGVRTAGGDLEAVDRAGRPASAQLRQTLLREIPGSGGARVEFRPFIRLPQDAEWYLPITRGIPRATGADVAFTLVPARRLISGAQTLSLLPDSMMSLVTDQGTRLLGYIKSHNATSNAGIVELVPPLLGADPLDLQREHEDVVQVNGPELPPRILGLMTGQAGSFESSSMLTGSPYLAGYARSAQLPLYVAVIMGTRPLYSAWARQAAAPATVLGIGVLAVLVYARQLRRALGRQESYVRQQEEANVRLRELTAQERRWADAFNSAAFGIAISDAQNNTLTAVNPAFASMHGMTVEEVHGQHISALYAPEERPRLPQLSDQVDREGHVTCEMRRLRKDGTIFPVQMDVTSVRAPDGTVAYRISSAIDITEAKRTEEVLRQAQKMEAVGNISGGMAHDFNNLLGVILGNLDLAAGSLPGEPREAAGLIAEATTAARRGADLTRRLLAFARRQPLHPVSVQPNELVAGMAQLLARVLGEHIEVELDLAPDLWPVLVDQAQLQSSLANLATNSRDAMPRGGRLTIATANCSVRSGDRPAGSELAPGDYVTIEVRDTGTGMTPEVREQIFEPFFTTKETGKGTGLGLAMVFGFAKQSGGHVSVHSEPGSGATFRLFLPRAEAAVELVQQPDRAVEPGRGETVLVVEDNAELRRVAVRQLSTLGYRVLQAESARGALAELERAGPVELLFSDVVMAGGVDGFALAREVLRRSPGIKVLLTSGFPGRGVNDAVGLHGGAVRLLDKPYDTQTLARAVRNALDSAA